MRSIQIKEIEKVELKIGEKSYIVTEPSSEDQYKILDKLKGLESESEKAKVMYEFLEGLGLSKDARSLIPAKALPKVIDFLSEDK